MSDVALLAADRLTKRFGGLAAVNEVSVKLYRDNLHAVIGPNGAGKSTLTNLLSGDLPPTSGTILLGGEETAGRSPEAISRLGLGRSYQKTNIFLPFTVWDNVRLAAQSRERHAPWNPLRWLQSASSMKTVNQRCERAIELAGLTHRTQTVAATVSHGEQRQLEIAMTLATEPTVLLLDEPLAGMGQADGGQQGEGHEGALHWDCSIRGGGQHTAWRFPPARRVVACRLPRVSRIMSAMAASRTPRA